MRCIFVVGPQSSGTRLWTEILLRSGCQGDSTHKQRLDIGYEYGFDLTLPLVWRRSYPHFKEREWPDLREMAERLPGFEFDIVVTHRDQHCMVSSQVAKRKGVPSHSVAYQAIEKAYRLIQEQCRKPYWYNRSVAVSYEALIDKPGRAAFWLSERLKLQTPDFTELEIRNENMKWKNHR